MEKIKDFIESIFISIMEWFYRIAGKELSDVAKAVWIQFAGFAIVGISNFLVNYIVYAFFLKVLKCSFHVSNIAGFIISVFNAFYWNNKYVFQNDETKRNWLITLLKTYVSYAFTGLLLTEILLIIEIDLFGLPELLGPVINLFITTPINFLLNKFWTFGESK